MNTCIRNSSQITVFIMVANSFLSYNALLCSIEYNFNMRDIRNGEADDRCVVNTCFN